MSFAPWGQTNYHDSHLCWADCDNQEEKLLSTRPGSMCSTVPALFPKTSIHLNHGTYFSTNCKWPHVIGSKDLPVLLCILFYIDKLFQVSFLTAAAPGNAQSMVFPSKAQEWHKTFTLNIWKSQQEVSNSENRTPRFNFSKSYSS